MNKLLFLIIFIVFIFLIYVFNQTNDIKKYESYRRNDKMAKWFDVPPKKFDQSDEIPINLWCIFTRVNKNAPLKAKFQLFVNSLVNRTSVPIVLHILIDKDSKKIADSILSIIYSDKFKYKFYNIKDVVSKIGDIVNAMMPLFSSDPGSYYNDALFYLSLGLYRIAPENHQYAIMLDCDIKFVSDVLELFHQFNSFPSTALFGLSYELSPVYRHVLYKYRLKNKNTPFGNYPGENFSNKITEFPTARDRVLFGFPGHNSGVLLINLQRLRDQKDNFENLISETSVNTLTDKYYFRGHLGDQDFYTLLAYEHPELVHQLPCEFNRQLCTWWRDNGYKEIFHNYFQCDNQIKIYHGNCNQLIPVS